MIPNIQAVVNELTPVFLPVREQTAVKQFDSRYKIDECLRHEYWLLRCGRGRWKHHNEGRPISFDREQHPGWHFRNDNKFSLRDTIYR